MSPDTDKLQARAEFYLCLAHAFMTPHGDGIWYGLRDVLADDLDEMGQLLNYPIATHVTDYRTAIAAIPDHSTVLQTYSGLFLTPPARVSINTGTYIDGALNGGCVLAMEAAYRRGGVERCETFMDLADHVSVQLEFIGYRLLAGIEITHASREADEFLATFVARWLPPFMTDLEKESDGANPWLHLTRLLSVAVAHDIQAAAIVLPEPSRLEAALDKERHKRAQHSVDAEGMAFIAQRLREKGLTTDHLETPPDQRDEARGWSRKVPPSPRRGSRLG
jgi:putative dimethyl sulfoxide reductase chaperone